MGISLGYLVAENLLSLALWLAGIGHFVVLTASVQVPSRLGWKEDFAKLSPFNHKVVWVYAFYTFGTILVFGVLTLFFHDEFLRGDRAALGLAGFIGIFWVGRIAIDFIYFDRKDWPKGKFFVVGHVLLTLLFICLASTYLALLVWHLCRS